ncbi:MAG: GTP cyclohydrolase I FolE [Spirochaetota bacterium]
MAMIQSDKVSQEWDTPLRQDAFKKTDEEKETIIRENFQKIMETLGLDLQDDSLRDTPSRVAKMYVREIFRGLNPANKPKISVFDNKYKYGQMLLEKNITFHSACEHHFLPIIGKAHIAYISSGKVIGLSKLNRLVDYYASRPQVQERMTVQLLKSLQQALDTEDVAVCLDAKHLCVSARGIRDTNSTTVTTEFSGKFLEDSLRNEFYMHIQNT